MMKQSAEKTTSKKRCENRDSLHMAYRLVASIR